MYENSIKGIALLQKEFLINKINIKIHFLIVDSSPILCTTIFFFFFKLDGCPTINGKIVTFEKKEKKL